VLANLPACGSGPGPSCRYTTQAGDSLSLIGDRFDLTRTCFEAANRSHTPVAPTAANNDFLGAAEAYIIPDKDACAALTGAAAAPAASASAAGGTSTATPTPAAATATATLACTPRPGASAPPPGC
jgi:hypothetical protein